MTFGPGAHPFSRFGHNAIRIVDRVRLTDIVYNFGTFSADSPHLVRDFLAGRLSYWLSRAHTPGTFASYRRENRDIETAELDLDAAEKRALAARLELNALPANRAYRYDYFHDNCSTRVRDALDAVTGGRVRAAMTGPGTMTLRAHALRSVADDLPLYLGLLIVLGPVTDQPIDAWTDAFLPAMLQRSLRAVTVGGGGSPVRPLVTSEQLVFASSRAPVPRAPPGRLADCLGAGIFAGLVLWVLGIGAARATVARIVFGAFVALIGLVSGAIGCFLVGAWAFTPHRAVYANQNILVFAPFALVLAVGGVALAIGARWAGRSVCVVAGLAGVLATVAWLLGISALPHQDNGALIALMLPIWAGLTGGACSVARSTRANRQADSSSLA